MYQYCQKILKIKALNTLVQKYIFLYKLASPSNSPLLKEVRSLSLLIYRNLQPIKINPKTK